MTDFKVTSSLFKDRIEISTDVDDPEGICKKLTRRVINLEEQAVKDGLKQLGWSNPKETQELKDRIRELTEFIHIEDAQPEPGEGVLVISDAGTVFTSVYRGAFQFEKPIGRYDLKIVGWKKLR